MPSVTIRAARPDDLDALVRLCADHAAYERAAYDPEGKAQKLGALLFEPAPRLACVVAERDRQPVGFATWTAQVATWSADRYAYLDCLYLDEAARGAGTGRRLVARVASDARAAGCRRLEWQTPAFNVRAVRFYGRLGATRADKVRFFLDAAAADRLIADPTRPDG